MSLQQTYQSPSVCLGVSWTSVDHHPKLPTRQPETSQTEISILVLLINYELQLERFVEILINRKYINMHPQPIVVTNVGNVVQRVKSAINCGSSSSVDIKWKQTLWMVKKTYDQRVKTDRPLPHI